MNTGSQRRGPGQGHEGQRPPDYLLNDLWSHRRTETAGAISAEVPSHGVVLFRVSLLRNPAVAPPAATVNLSLPGTMTVPLTLAAGSNAVEFADPTAYTPDFDRIIVANSPS